MNEPVKKESPLPLARATEQGVAPRPLAPRSKKVALPIAMAAAMVLAGGGAGVYAYAANAEARAKAAADGCPVRAREDQNFIVRAVEKVTDFIHPTQPPMMAGEVSPVAPLPPPPVTSASNAIAPVPPAPLGGAPPAPALDSVTIPAGNPPNGVQQQANTPDPQAPGVAGTSSPVAPPPPTIPPKHDHPKLGGKPVAVHPDI